MKYGNWLLHDKVMDESVLKGILGEDVRDVLKQLGSKAEILYILNVPKEDKFSSSWEADV